MTQEDDEYAMERLKKMPSVASFLEMAEELGIKEDVIVEKGETAEKKSSKMAQSELEAVDEFLAPVSEEGSRNESTEEQGFHNAGKKEVNIDPLESGK
jgi:hypothetical protein